ncbi:MAG TPA: MMPL family transporter [Thermoleophilia bacterium]|nr:MMPL family transporter [Thermoleophilia bacterium]
MSGGGGANGRRVGFTQRMSLACARHPWWTIAVWLIALVTAGAVYVTMGDVFTSSSRFLSEPDSKMASDLIQQHGGNAGSSIAQAGAAVRSLADGLDSAHAGARKLAKGSRSLTSGAHKLHRGLHKLAKGAGEVSSGSTSASDGASRLSSGLASASRGADSLSSGLRKVTGATGAFRGGLSHLSGGGSELSSAAGQVESGAKGVAGGAATAAQGVRQAAATADQIAGGASTLEQLIGSYAQAHPDWAADPTFQQILGLAGQVETGTSGLASGLQQSAGGLTTLASNADAVASGASGVASGARRLSSGISRSVSGARTLDLSLGKLASGGAALAGGVGSAAAGSRQLAAGQRQLAAGAGKLAAGVGGAAAGSGRLAQGSGRIRTGASKLSEGLASASSGAGKLDSAIQTVGTLSSHDDEVVVVHSPTLTVDDPAFEAEVRRIRGRLDALPAADVVGVLSRYDRGIDAEVRDGLTSADRHSTLLKVELATTTDHAMNHMDGVYKVVEEANALPRFEVAVTGAAAAYKDAQDLSHKDLRRGEMIGIPVALVILVLVFGALVAAGLPLVLSVFSIVIGLAITVLIGQAFELSVFALNILTATGLAVGIDYSLFIVSRYREERRGGLDKMEAIAAASATASNAVFFSGMTVVLALVGMLIVPLSIFASLGIGAMSAVFAAVAAALTLLPAILSLLGDRVDALRVPWLGRQGRSHGEHGWWGRTARRVMRRPAVSLILGVVLLLAVAAPLLTMRSGGMSADTFPDSYTSKQGLEMLKRDFAAGLSEPTTVVIDGDVGDARVQAALKDFVDRLDKDGRFTVTGLSTSADGSLAVLQMIQDADAQSEAAKASVRALRDTLVPASFDGSGAKVYVGGNTAAQMDSTDLTDHYMPIVIGVVLSLSFLLLLLAFRSVLVAATAIVMNLLSVGAAYGALTLVFQHGWGSIVPGLITVESIESWVPLLMFCVLFGLSMDYQVFLLSRIRERWFETRASKESVVFGVQSTAGIITGAALIMVAVFLGMGSGRMVVLQELGFGLAIAVLLDAFVVRVIVAPATISLLGDRYWRMPHWLEWLPRIDIEGKTQAGEAEEGAAAGGRRGAGATGHGAADDGARASGHGLGRALPSCEAGGGI